MLGTNKPLDTTTHQRILDLTAQGVSSREIAKQLGVSATAVLKYQKLPVEGGSLSSSDTVSGDTREISMPRTRIKTEAELVEACEIDLNVWMIDRCIFNKWEVGSKNAAGDVEVTPLFQVKAFLKRRVNMVAAQDEIANLVELSKSLFKAPPLIRSCRPSHENMLEVGIPDIHFGKYADPEETGGEPYTLAIARSLHGAAVERIKERSAALVYDRILYVVGNDYLNADNKALTTTALTPQPGDARYHQLFRAAVETSAATIYSLLDLAPVDVIVVPGNHDEASMFHLGHALELMFNSSKFVNVDSRPRARKYYQFGEVMLMHCHGHKGKHPDYPLLMATEQREMWGTSRFKEVHTGHKHGTSVAEYHGVRVRILSSLCAADAWHADSAYTGNIRAAEAFQWNKHEGLIGTVLYTAPDQGTGK